MCSREDANGLDDGYVFHGRVIPFRSVSRGHVTRTSSPLLGAGAPLFLVLDSKRLPLWRGGHEGTSHWE